MATDLLLVREGLRLGAADPFSLEGIENLRLGEMVTATIRRTRNHRFHRLFFALLNLVFKAQDRHATLEGLLDEVKIATGHYDLVTLPGKVPLQIIKPRSISFARMDETAFRQFFEKAMLHIITEILPGMNREDLEREVLLIVGN